MKAAKEKEGSLKEQYHPLEAVIASTLCIIVDMQGIILAWYLPGILSDSRQVGLFSLSDHSRKLDVSQNSMLMAQKKLHPLITIPRSSSSWHNDLEKFPPGGEGPQGLVNLSPT